MALSEVLGDSTDEKILGYDQFITILTACNPLPFYKVMSSILHQLNEYSYEDDYTLIAVEITDEKFEHGATHRKKLS